MEILKVILGFILMVFGGIGTCVSAICMSPFGWGIGSIIHAVMVAVTGAVFTTVLWTLFYTAILIFLTGLLGLCLSMLVAAIGAATIDS